MLFNNNNNNNGYNITRYIEKRLATLHVSDQDFKRMSIHSK